MKYLLTALAILGLNGCTLVDAYLMTKYDPNEYKIIAEIRNDANTYKSQCGDAVVSKTNSIVLANKTKLFEIYSEQIPRNDDSIKAAKNLNEITQGLATRYQNGDTVSAVFCKLKFDSVEHSAELMQHVIGNKPR
jgi:hypothetical protein